jgi:hypothetical protein
MNGHRGRTEHVKPSPEVIRFTPDIQWSLCLPCLTCILIDRGHWRGCQFQPGSGHFPGVNASAVRLRPELAKRSADTDTDLSPVRAMAIKRQLKYSTVQQMWPVATYPAEFWFLIRDAVVLVQSIAGLAPVSWADSGLESPGA